MRQHSQRQPGVQARKGKAMYLAWDMSNKGAPDYVRSMSETVRGGRTRARWSSGRRRRQSELAEMTGSLTVVRRRRRRRVGLRFVARDLDQLKAMRSASTFPKEEESGSSVHGSENCVHEY